jgi:hypothetical protein
MKLMNDQEEPEKDLFAKPLKFIWIKKGETKWVQKLVMNATTKICALSFLFFKRRWKKVLRFL